MLHNALFTEQEFEHATQTDSLNLSCKRCSTTFSLTKRKILLCMSPNTRETGEFCSTGCSRLSRRQLNCEGNYIVSASCGWCSATVERPARRVANSKSGKVFCCLSCVRKYNNAYTKRGYSRSKLEQWLESKLSLLYPTLEIHFNRKDAINSELDIYIPSLKLAFELNGIFHYEPIHGQKKLDQTQNNDQRKFQACLERGIEFCTIDTSKQKYFKEYSSAQYLDIIRTIIDQKSLTGDSNTTNKAL